MADGEKPYRLYRGGRVKGKVPTVSKPSRTPDSDGDGKRKYRGPGPKPRGKRWGWGRRIAVGAAAFFVLLIVWLVAGYLSFRSGAGAANDRLSDNARAALQKQNGLLISKTTDILLLGSDHARTKARSGDRHADSIMLVRSDPKHHRIVYLSILRDLRVPIPGHGEDKINVAFQIGGPALAIRTVRSFTGLPVNHVVLVDFADFEQLIDSIGGVTIDVPAPVVSKFDCPYPPKRCATWPGWRFKKGKQHMDGRRALIYSRIRKNSKDPGDSDATRIERQQQVLQAISDKLVSFGTFIKLPFIGGDLMKPLATDLSSGQLLQLGWRKFRGHTLRCRLGGEDDGSGSLQPDEEARAVIQMVKGTSAPQPVVPGSQFGSGCFVGQRSGG